MPCSIMVNVMCHAIRLLPVLTIRWIIRQEWIFPAIRIYLFLPLIWQSVPTIILWEDMKMIPVPVCFTWQTIIFRRVRSNGPGGMAISDRLGTVTWQIPTALISNWWPVFIPTISLTSPGFSLVKKKRLPNTSCLIANWGWWRMPLPTFWWTWNPMERALY